MSPSITANLSLNTPWDDDSTTALGNPFQYLTTLPEKKFLLISNLNLPWRNLRPFPLVLSQVICEKRPTPSSFQVVVEGSNISPEPSLLQTKQPQFPQLLLPGLVLQTLHQLCSPSLDTLQGYDVFINKDIKEDGQHRQRIPNTDNPGEHHS